MAEATIPEPDEMLFHDLAAIAARVQDEAQRIRDIGYHPRTSSDVAHQAGIAFAKLDTLEGAMFDTANTLHSMATAVAPESASVSKEWNATKQACRDARRLASEARSQRLAAVGG